MRIGGGIFFAAFVTGAFGTSCCLQVTAEETSGNAANGLTGTTGALATGAASGFSSGYFGGTSTGSATTTGGSAITLAGNGQAGFRDGSGDEAEFLDPSGLVIDPAGNVYVADTGNHRIRRIDSSGKVSTIAGDGTQGFADGPGDAAEFSEPWGLALDASGNLYVGDYGNCRVRKVDPTGHVRTLAGNATCGLVDGAGGPTNDVAEFWGPTNLAVDGAGNVYVADGAPGGALRKIDTAGMVTTISVQFAPNEQEQNPTGLAFDGNGRLYVTDGYNNRVLRLEPPADAPALVCGNGMTGAVNGAGGTAEFADPQGIAVDASGTLYVADTANSLIRTIDAAHDVGTLGTSIGLKQPIGVALDTKGDLYIADTSNNRIVKISLRGNPGVDASALLCDNRAPASLPKWRNW